MGDSATSPQQAATTLTDTVDRMLNEVSRLPADLVTWKPAADVWSVLEILCHVDEFVPFWTREALCVVSNAGYVWGRDHTNVDRLAAVNAAATRTLADVTRSLRAGAAAAAAQISMLDASDLEREATSMNPRWGLKPASFIVNDLIVGHVAKHLGQIQRNVTAFQARDGQAG